MAILSHSLAHSPLVGSSSLSVRARAPLMAMWTCIWPALLTVSTGIASQSLGGHHALVSHWSGLCVSIYMVRSCIPFRTSLKCEHISRRPCGHYFSLPHTTTVRTYTVFNYRFPHCLLFKRRSHESIFYVLFTLPGFQNTAP